MDTDSHFVKNVPRLKTKRIERQSLLCEDEVVHFSRFSREMVESCTR